MSKALDVKIFSDVACPWCYVGLKRFQLALKSLPEVNAKVEFHAFMLDPNFPQYESKPLFEHMAAKGFPMDRVTGMVKQLNSAGDELGIKFNFEKATTVNMTNAHRMIHFARENGKSVEVKDNIFKEYFTENSLVNDPDVLIKCATKAGLDAEKAKAALSDPHTLEGVKADLKDARDYGISGVPFFIINDKYAVSGARHESEFAEVINKALAESA